MRIFHTLFATMLFVFLTIGVMANPKVNDSVAGWSFHFQQSMVNQWHGAYHFNYAGPSSLDSNSETKLSLTTTMYIGRSLWKGGAIYFSPEVTAGNGLSGTHGMAGFTNGEIYRVGNPTPTPFIARAYLQQSFALPGATFEMREDGLNQLGGYVPSSRFTINIGKFCLADFFDANTYSHDARGQFLNWALMGQGAWDFPADTRGYTSGIEMELVKPKWSLLYAYVQMPKVANALNMDWNMTKSFGQTLEYSHKMALVGNRPGMVRVDLFLNSSMAPKYADATKQLKTGDDTDLAPIFAGLKGGTAYGGLKYGFGINMEQEVTDAVGVFLRYGWNDGKTASWAFTDIDRSVQAGVSIGGNRWKRPNDNFGLAEAINGISKDHQDFFAAGGYSYIIGDGHLNYGMEYITEAYYKAKVCKNLFVSLDYQLVFNPGYNKDRQGPISVPGLRVHVEF